MSEWTECARETIAELEAKLDAQSALIREMAEIMRNVFEPEEPYLSFEEKCAQRDKVPSLLARAKEMIP